MDKLTFIEDLEDLYPSLYEDDFLENEKKEDRDYKNWQVSSDGTVFFPDIKIFIKEKIDPGLYVVEANQTDGFFARKKEINVDRLYKVQDEIISDMLSEVKLFWKKADLFKAAGLIHKRGIILTGGPGQGKTSIIHLMCKELIADGGVVFKIESPSDLTNYKIFIQSYFRRIEPNTPILLIIEDIDKMMDTRESELLSLLDGQDSIDHHVVLATTNRIQDLNDLLLRPSRFDWIIEIEAPTEASRRIYFEEVGIKDEELELFVSESKDLSMAQLREIYTSVKLLDNDLQLVLKRLRANKNKTPNSTYKPKTSMGFGK